MSVVTEDDGPFKNSNEKEEFKLKAKP